MENKRILTVQDISFVGQCSMTVAMPILSAWGLETCILPTALLSTHTGGFCNPVVRHLSDMLPDVHAHWQREGITFDCIYTGYLGSSADIDHVIALAEDLLTKEGKLIVDPAMADHGKRYSGLNPAYVADMSRLCARADILLPNITEAAMLTNRPYDSTAGENYVASLLERLPQRDAVITGVQFSERETGVLLRSDGKIYAYHHPIVEGSYHGTGDIFAACFTGAFARGYSVPEAAELSAELTYHCIRTTHAFPAHSYGTRFESILPEIVQMCR